MVACFLADGLPSSASSFRSFHDLCFLMSRREYMIEEAISLLNSSRSLFSVSGVCLDITHAITVHTTKGVRKFSCTISGSTDNFGTKQQANPLNPHRIPKATSLQFLFVSLLGLSRHNHRFLFLDTKYSALEYQRHQLN